MLAFNSHTKIGKIWYEKDFWSGKTTITVDGILLTQLSPTLFTYEKDGLKYTVTMRGNDFSGIRLNFTSDEKDAKTIIIPMTEGIKGYEYLISLISFIVLGLWYSIAFLMPETNILNLDVVHVGIAVALAFVSILLATKTEKTGLRLVFYIVSNVISFLVPIISLML